MGQRRRIILCIGLLVLGACSERKVREQALPMPAQPAAQKPSPLSIYTPDGKLKGSRERVEWLEIPLAFHRTGRDFGRHVLLEAEAVQLEKARDFLSRRMLTGSAEESQGSVFYRGAIPPSGGDAVPLNVRLTERPGAGVLELDIEALTYGDAQPLPLEQAKKILAEEALHAE
jgi:hypothetical protein